jgi:hypothetical protein
MNMIWKQSTPTTWLLYDEEDGKIHGKIMSTLTQTTFNCFWQNMPLGEYMTLDQAKKAVENPPEKTDVQNLINKISNSNGLRP